jgi:hypothetical protein
MTPTRLALTLTLLLAPAVLPAQTAAGLAMPAVTAEAPAPMVTPAPTVTPTPMTAAATATTAAEDAPQVRKPRSRGGKLMVIGGAAVVTGIIVGGPAGGIITVSGAVVGLYGLWRWLN